jgi:hypothetical protein
VEEVAETEERRVKKIEEEKKRDKVRKRDHEASY